VTSLRSVEFYARRALESAAGSNQFERWRDDLRIAASQPAGEVVQCCRWVGDDFVAERSTVPEHVGDVLPEVADFVCLLARHGKQTSLPDVAIEYSRLLDEYYGIRHALVTSAIALDDETLRHVARKLKDLTGVEHVVDVKVDPSIIGGLIIRIGDRVIDRSVRARLSLLRQDVLETETPASGA
jgi:F-type H+-transporting ATPase subunit delta